MACVVLLAVLMLTGCTVVLPLVEPATPVATIAEEDAPLVTTPLPTPLPTAPSIQQVLAALDLPNARQMVQVEAERYISEGKDVDDIRALVALARGLGAETDRMAAYFATATPTVTETPAATATE